MIAVDPIRAAVSAHRAAWDAFQAAPGGDESAESMDACCAMADALDALVLAACAFPLLTAPLPDGAADLLAHLRWWLAEEAEFADGYQPEYGVLQARATDLAAVLDRADPIYAALAAVEGAEHQVARVLAETREDESPAADARCDEEDRRRDEAEKALRAMRPATLQGLAALVRHYARTASDPDSDGLSHIVEALAGVPVQPLPPAAAPDPILPLIKAADAANTVHIAACEGLDWDDDERMQRHNQAVDDVWRAGVTLRAAVPATAGGLHALAAFYVRTVEPDERAPLDHLSAAIARVLP